VEFAGEIIGFQMGLSIAQVYNPISGATSNPLGRFLTVAFLLVFLVLDGHHYILRALVVSFEVVPLAGANLAATGPLLLGWTGQLFITALRLAAPFMITIFMLDAALGVFARLIPQADLFSLGLPLKLFAGLSLTYFYLQHFFPVIPDMILTMYGDMLTLIEMLVPV
jgi:flagellar biosynthetic protein FliR